MAVMFLTRQVAAAQFRQAKLNLSHRESMSLPGIGSRQSDPMSSKAFAKSASDDEITNSFPPTAANL
jgi:hypothetical protein